MCPQSITGIISYSDGKFPALIEGTGQVHVKILKATGFMCGGMAYVLKLPYCKQGCLFILTSKNNVDNIAFIFVLNIGQLLV